MTPIDPTWLEAPLLDRASVFSGVVFRCGHVAFMTALDAVASRPQLSGADTMIGVAALFAEGTTEHCLARFWALRLKHRYAGIA